jgi:hypothetical protein
MAKRETDTFQDLREDCVEELTVDEGEVFIGIDTGFHTSGIQFLASVWGSDTYNPAVHFVIRTVNWETGERHPYFVKHRASVLAARAIQHFDMTRPVSGLEFSWVRELGDDGKPSDNYTTYVETRNRLRNNISIEDARREAVLATWTMQKIALPNGFTHLGKIEEKIWETDDPNLPTEIKGTVWRKLHSART